MNQLLSFEIEKCRDPRRFPMHFRLKLDLCGIKLSKCDWIAFDPAEKEKLLAMPCDTPAQIAALRTTLQALIRACGGNSIEIAPAASAAARLPWTADAAIPETVRQQVRSMAKEKGNLQRWGELSDLQRFALIKLTEPGKVKPQLRQALEEFSMLQPADYLVP